MRNLISRIASTCALTLTRWSGELRGLSSEPRGLTEFATSVSSDTLIKIAHSPIKEEHKVEMAEGMVDGASRYLDGERPVVAAKMKENADVRVTA